MRSLMQALGATDIPACYREVAPLAGGMTVTIEKMVEAAKQEPAHPGGQSMVLFRKYCAECHFGSDAIKDLHMENLSQFKAYRGEHGENPLDMLSSKNMPPHKAPQPSDADRKEMLRLLGNGL